VLLNGRPLDISWAAEHVPAIWKPGTPARKAATPSPMCFFGDVNPGARLPVFLAAHHRPGSHLLRPQSYARSRRRSNIHVALCGFRHGASVSIRLRLSYTTFGFSRLQLDRKEIGRRGQCRSPSMLENQGSVAGDEVVQLYNPPACR